MCLHSEKDRKGDQQGRLQVLEHGCIPSNWNGRKHGEETITELSDGDTPRIRLEAQIQHYLWNNRVNRAVEDPSLHGKGEGRQRKIGILLEEYMSQQAI